MRCPDIKQRGKIYLRLFSLGYRIHGNCCTIALHKIYVIYTELSLLLIRGQKCVNLILTETEKSTRISLFLYLFILPVPCSPGRASSFSNSSPLQVACLAPKHGRQRILGIQDATVAVCKAGGGYSATLGTLCEKEKGR